MVDVILTILGLIMVLSIVAIWAAWSEAVFYGIFASFVAAFISAVAIAYLWRKRPTK